MRNGRQVDSDGTESWYENGHLHRYDGPAVIYPDGSEEWYFKGHLHREDGPAVITDQKVSYYFMGKYYFQCKKRTEKSDHKFRSRTALRIIQEVDIK